MGWFGKHDDGYVSPFDVDDSPAYVDFTSADDISNDTHDDTRKETPARRQQVDSASSASSQQQTSYQQKPVAPSAREQQHRQRQTDIARKSVQRNQQTVNNQRYQQNTRTNTTGRGNGSKKETKKSGAKGFWIGVLIVVFVFASKIGPRIYNGTLFDGGQDSGPSSSFTWNASSATKPTKEKTGKIASYGGMSATLTIVKATAGPNDSYGKPTVIVTYHWRNTGEKATTFGSFAMELNVFQKGVGLIRTSVYNSDSTPAAGYSPRSTDITVNPGAQSDATIAYQLRDKTSDLYVEANKADRLSEGVVSAFSIADGGSTFKQIDSTPLREAPQASSEELKPLKPINSYSAKMLASITNVARGPDDYRGNPTIIVTIDWVNKSEDAEPLSNAAELTVTQNGLKLDHNYYATPMPAGYEELSFSRSAQPGALARSTVSFRLNDVDHPVKVTLASRYGGDGSITKTVKLPKESGIH